MEKCLLPVPPDTSFHLVFEYNELFLLFFKLRFYYKMFLQTKDKVVFISYFSPIGCNPSLKVLKLEDINLSEYHQEILQFLERSVLEGTTRRKPHS